MTGYFATTFKSEHTFPDEMPCKSPNYEKDPEGRCVMYCYHERLVHEDMNETGWTHSDDETECN